jgi:predicted metalloprotease with PDZ domain
MDVKVKLGEFTEAEAKKELSVKFPRLFPAPPERPGQLAPRAFPPKSMSPERAPGRPRMPRFALEQRKFIGVSLQELNKDMAEYFGVKEGTGLLVAQFSEDSPAQKAGLKIGDVILSADGKRVEAVDVLSEMIQDKKKGDKIKLEIVRDKKPMSLDVEIGEEDRGFEAISRGSEMAGKASQDQMKNFEEYQKSLGKLYEENVKNFSEEMEKYRKDFPGRDENTANVFRSFRNLRRV